MPAKGGLIKIIIIASGNVNTVKPEWLEGADLIIAADGGANHCIRLGIKPDVVIGDLDSATEENIVKLSDSEIIKDTNQNKTDLQLAIELALRRGATSFLILGAIGTRLDHTLANLFTLATLENAEIRDEHNDVWFVTEGITILGKPNETVSVIALEETTGLTYHGLKWDVQNETVPFGWVGTSNVMTGDEAKISIKSGKLFVMKARD